MENSGKGINANLESINDLNSLFGVNIDFINCFNSIVGAILYAAGSKLQYNRTTSDVAKHFSIYEITL
jgi:hypothetical protein